MRLHLTISIAVVFSFLASVSFGAGEAQKADTQAALSALENWLGPGPNRDQWEKYLRLKELHAQIDNFTDVKDLNRSLVRFETGVAGLELPQFVRLHEALESWIEAVSIPTPADAVEAVKKAAADFHPPTAADLAAAKGRLDGDLKTLDQYLARLGSVGAGWRKYLELDELHKELAAGPKQAELPAPAAADTAADAAPDAAAAADDVDDSRLATLWRIYSHFTADAAGLEMPQFLAAGNALEDYIELAEVTEAANAAPAEGQDKQPTLAEQYTAKMNGLAKMLEDYQSKPSEELAANIDRDLLWLWRRHLDRDVVNLVRRCYGRPNFYVAIQKGLLSTGIDRPIDERNAPITDNILGTSINGRATTVGQVKVDLVPIPNRAMLDVLLSGTVTTNTVGQNGPATIQAQGTTQIAGRKRISIDSLGVHTVPATAAAVTRTRINGVSVSGLGQGVAQQRVAEGKPAAERVGAQHAEARLKARMDKELDPKLEKANHNFAEKFRNPLVRQRKFPALLEFSTMPERIQLEVLEATASQLSTATEPPQLQSWETTHPLVVVVHQSAVNNGTAEFLAGITLKDDEVREQIKEMNNGELPERLANDQDQEPWSIRFAKIRPISLDVTPGGLTVTVRGRVTTGEGPNKKSHVAMNVRATYKIEQADAGPQLIRQGDLEITPPNFDPQTTKLTGSDVMAKTVMKKKFGKMFPPEVKPEPLVLGGQWKDAGHLIVDQLQANDGWISAAYRWVPKTTEEKKVAQRD